MSEPKQLNGNLRHQLRILIRPLLVSGCVCAFWYFVLHHYKFNVGDRDETAMTNMAIPVFAVFHGLVAAMVLSKVWDEFKLIRVCIRDDDVHTFRQCIRDRIPLTVHILLGAMSFILMSGVMLVDYHNPAAGLFIVASVAMILALYWEVATTLDDPFRAPWFAGQIPPTWAHPPSEEKDSAPPKGSA